MVWGKPCGSRECPSGADGAIQPLAMVLSQLLVQRALKEELEARGEGKSGNQAWLRRRLHAAIVSEYIESGDE